MTFPKLKRPPQTTLCIECKTSQEEAEKSPSAHPISPCLSRGPLRPHGGSLLLVFEGFHAIVREG